MPADSDGTIYQYYNCLLLREHCLVKEDLWVRNGQIINPEELFYLEKTVANVQIDCKKGLISPGLIDVQINGAYGIDFSQNVDEEGMQMAAEKLLSHGVTSFCPTIVTSPPEVYRKVLPQMKKRNGSKAGAGILGLHLEGPFISKEKRGAHPPDFILPFDGGYQDMLNVYGSLEDVSIVTLAPEKKNAAVVIEELVKQGIVVSLGHSVANLTQGESAARHGATFITHLFNAMLPFHHRDPHLVGLLTSNRLNPGQTIYYGLISDGIHTHPAALRIAQKVYAKGMVLITDAIPAMGLPEGCYSIGQQKIEIKGKRAVIAGTETLCGSIATLIECVRHFYKSTDCSTVEALETASLHPAEMLKITDRKGTLAYETDADFIILDDTLHVEATFIAGELVWESDTAPERTPTYVSK